MSGIVRVGEWCRDCRSLLGEHISVDVGDRTEYNGLELVPWLEPVENRARTFRPARRAIRRYKRTLLTKPGPATVTCRCGFENVFDVPERARYSAA